MSKQVNRYRVFCQTENTFVYTWSDSKPTTCPNNNEHTIVDDFTLIVDTVSSTDVNISKSFVGTKGYYMMEGVLCHIPYSQRRYTHDFIFPYSICVYGVIVLTSEQHRGDSLCIAVAPDTIIGYLIQNVAQGSNTYFVNETVLAYLIPGFFMSISTNGVDFVECGKVITVNIETGQVVTNLNVPRAFSMGSYVALTIQTISNVQLTEPYKYELGYGTLAGKPIPANTIIRLIYNNSNGKAKDINITYEYTY
jgi:hypothetical protein